MPRLLTTPWHESPTEGQGDRLTREGLTGQLVSSAETCVVTPETSGVVGGMTVSVGWVGSGFSGAATSS